MKRTMITLAILAVAASGCTRIAVNLITPSMRVIADESFSKTDTQFMEMALPGNMLMLEGMHRLNPRNEDLKLLIAEAKCGYALGFLEDEDPERAMAFYLEGKDMALEALERLDRGYRKAREDGAGIKDAVAEIDDEDAVPALFWAGNCWMNWLNMNLTNPRALFARPSIEALMKKVLELNDEFFFGAPHVIFGAYYAVIPAMAGGGLDKSKHHFDQAFEISEGDFLLAHYYYAKNYATALKDNTECEMVEVEAGEDCDDRTGEELFEWAWDYIEDFDPEKREDLALVNAMTQRKLQYLAPLRERHF